MLEPSPERSAIARSAAEAECIRIARRLVADERRRFGLLPVSSSTPLAELVCSLAATVSDLTGANVAAIDIGGRWPIWSRATSVATKEPWLGQWLYGARVAALRPARPVVAGEGLTVLRAMLDCASSRCGHVLVDLSGLRSTGEHFGACTLVDGVCLVALAGKTRDREVLTMHRELDPAKDLGVLLLS